MPAGAMKRAKAWNVWPTNPLFVQFPIATVPPLRHTRSNSFATRSGVAQTHFKPEPGSGFDSSPVTLHA